MLGLRDGDNFGIYPAGDWCLACLCDLVPIDCNVIYEEPGFGKFNGRIGI